MTELLAVRGLSKRFGGVLALDRLDFAVAANEIVGLIGPNGSGKTTFFNVITGLYAADAGRITFDGSDMTRAAQAQSIRPASPAPSSARGMSLPLSVFDNIMVGNHKHLNHGLAFNLFRRGAFKLRNCCAAAMPQRATLVRFSSRRSRTACSSPRPACR